MRKSSIYSRARKNTGVMTRVDDNARQAGVDWTQQLARAWSARLGVQIAINKINVGYVVFYLDKSEWFPGLDEMCWWLEDISNNAPRGA